MKRDMDLIRNMLLYVEKENEFNEENGVDLGHFPDVNPRLLKSHFKLIRQNGYLNKLTLASGGYILAGEITNEGYDFLDSVRDPEIWRKTKDAAHAAGGFSLRLLGRLATGFLEKKIEEKTGVEISL